ncbi:MAG: 4a-hydroxytetrahydrobiopterin dehydratase [Candidatus Nitrosocosmicus sp.]
MTISNDRIQKRLSSSSDFDNWELKDDKIVKIFQFPSFMHSINFVNKIAEISESHNHHPIITINWKTVKISLKSFDVNALTERDLNLAVDIENIYKSTL